MQSSKYTTWRLLQLCLLPLFLICLNVSSSPIIVFTRFDEDFAHYDFNSGTPFKNCGGQKSILKSVQVIPCELTNGGDHCVIHRGSNVTFKMSFLSQENSTSLKAKIYGIIDYIPVPFPCPQPNACLHSGISCPIIKGNLYNYAISAFVKPNYPKGSLWIKGELEDDDGGLLVCVEIPVKIE